MRKITTILTSLLIFIVLIMPAVSLAQIEAEPKESDEGNWHGLVPCGRETGPATAPTPGVAGETDNIVGGGQTVKKPCGFDDLMTLVNNIIYFILFYLALPIAAIMFAYAGFLLITAGGEAAGARTKAKTIFLHALLGLVIALAAYLIIKLILSTLGYQGGWIGF